MLQTLNHLSYGPFKRVKPLLLLTYLALEGQTTRRNLRQLLWPNTEQADTNLRAALYRLRSLNADLLHGEDLLATTAPCDATHLLTLRGQDALRAYTGPFLHSTPLEDVSAEFEEWVLTQRERLAGHVQLEALTHAESSPPAQAAALAEQVYRLPGAAPPDLTLLRRLLALTIPGSALETQLQAETTSLDERPTPVPATPTRSPLRLLGRTPELNALLGWAEQPGGGVAVVSGPGGIGKSTLARELLRELHGQGRAVTFVNAEGADTTSEVIARILAQVAPGRGVPDTWAGLRRVLPPQPTLLLDGLDALSSATDLRDLHDEVRAALPDVRWIITTRRTPQQTAGLHLLRLGGLLTPPPDAPWAEVQAAPAVQLLTREARRTRHDFSVTPDNAPLLSAMSRRLHGHPLALTLAASWLRVEDLPQVHARVLAQAANLHTPYATTQDADQHALNAVLGRSWNLLTLEQQTALLRLSTCADLDPKDAPALHVPEDHLNALLEHNFLEAHLPGSERLRLYPAFEGLIATQAARHPDLMAAAQATHAQHYLNLLTSHAPTETVIRDELENIRRALLHALSNNTLPGQDALYRLMTHYDASVKPASGTETFQQFMDTAEDHHAPTDVQAAAQIACMWLAHRAGRLLDAETLANRFLKSPLADDPGSRMRALNTLSSTYAWQGRHREAADFAEQAMLLAQQLQDQARCTAYLMNMLVALLKSGEFTRLQALSTHADEVVRQTDWLHIKLNWQWLRAQLPEADISALFQEGQLLLHEAQASGNPQIEQNARLNLAEILLKIDQPRPALQHSQEVISASVQEQGSINLLSAHYLASRALYALGRAPQARLQAQSGLQQALVRQEAAAQYEGLLVVARDLSKSYRSQITAYMQQLIHDGQTDYLQVTAAQKYLQEMGAPILPPTEIRPSEDMTRQLLTWL